MSTSEAIGVLIPRRASAPVRLTSGLVAGRVAASILSFGYMTVIARRLDASQVGALSLGLTLAVALSVIPDMGLPMIVADRVGRHPEQAFTLVVRVVRLRLVAAAVTAALLVAMYWAGSDASLWVPVLMGVSVAATAVHSTVTAALRGLGTVLPDALNEAVSRFLVLAVGGVLLWAGGGIITAAAVLALADLGSAVVLWRVVRHRAPERAPVPAGIITAGTVVPLAAALLVASLHTRIDVWLLALLGTSVQVAHYVLPARLAEGLLLPAGVCSALILPLTSATADPRARARQGLRYAVAIAGVVGLGAALVFAGAGPLLRLSFGPRYAADAGVLRLLCVAAVPGALGVGLAPLVAILARRALLRWMCVALVVNVAANLLLIPGHGEIGAAWSSVLSVSIVALGLSSTIGSLAFPRASLARRRTGAPR